MNTEKLEQNGQLLLIVGTIAIPVCYLILGLVTIYNPTVCSAEFISGKDQTVFKVNKSHCLTETADQVLPKAKEAAKD